MEHLIFNCPRVSLLWRKISTVCKVNIKLKHIIFGFLTDVLIDLQYCISVIAYYIYKILLLYSLDYKLEEYKRCNIHEKLKNELFWKCEVLKAMKQSSCVDVLSKIYLNPYGKYEELFFCDKFGGLF